MKHIMPMMALPFKNCSMVQKRLMFGFTMKNARKSALTTSLNLNAQILTTKFYAWLRGLLF